MISLRHLPLVALPWLFVACAATPRDAEEKHWMTYLETVRQLEAEGAVLERGSPAEERAVARFRELMSDFKASDFRERIPEVYAEEIFFNDTLKTVRGVEELQEYLAASAAAVEVATVEFHDLVVDHGNYYFRWEMSLRFKKLARGRTHRSLGMSHIRFDREGKVVLHQDFWDAAGGFFEHLPLVGRILRRIKHRL